MASVVSIFWLLVASPIFALAQELPLPPQAKIDFRVAENLRFFGKSNIFVNMREGTSGVLGDINNRNYTSREERLSAIGTGLQSLATKTQGPVLEVISKVTGVDVQSYWLSNQIYVGGAPTSLVQTLSLLPGVGGIEEVQTYQLFEPVGPVIAAKQSSGYAWGVEKIQAPTAWSISGGTNGTGIIVANIDTGVTLFHEALSQNYRGTYGWFDPYSKTRTPEDVQGHGTHVMGSICGSKGIGVAPGAKWMACKGCSTNGCGGNELLACAQFMTCPTLPDGSAKDCTKAPHVINNSWGGGQGQTWYNASIAAWKAARIVPVFSNGNSGPNCGTANSPGDQDVIAVGATDINDNIASYSSRGPATNRKVKPEISAPGSAIRSAQFNTNAGYVQMSGTSMAAPHLTGVVALITATKPNLSYNQVKTYLSWASETSPLKKNGQTCGGTSDSSFPNNIYGSGRVNAYWAVYYAKNYNA